MVYRSSLTNHLTHQRDHNLPSLYFFSILFLSVYCKVYLNKQGIIIKGNLLEIFFQILSHWVRVN